MADNKRTREEIYTEEIIKPMFAKLVDGKVIPQPNEPVRVMFIDEGVDLPTELFNSIERWHSLGYITPVNSDVPFYKPCGPVFIEIQEADTPTIVEGK